MIREFLAVEYDRLRDERTARQRRGRRDEPVQPQRVAPDRVAVAAPMPDVGDVEREVVRGAVAVGLRLDHAPGRVAEAVGPKVVDRAGTHERLGPYVERLAVAAGHETGVRVVRAAATVGLRDVLVQRRVPSASGDVSRGQPQVHVRCAIVRRDLIRVKLGDSARGIREPFGGGPLEEIGRRAGHDVAAVAESAVVFDVAAAIGIPKREILRVERPLGHDRLLGQERPVNPVGRLVGRRALRPCRRGP